VTVLYEHIKRDVVGCVHVFVSNSLRYVFVKTSKISLSLHLLQKET